MLDRFLAMLEATTGDLCWLAEFYPPGCREGEEWWFVIYTHEPATRFAECIKQWCDQQVDLVRVTICQSVAEVASEGLEIMQDEPEQNEPEVLDIRTPIRGHWYIYRFTNNTDGFAAALRQMGRQAADEMCDLTWRDVAVMAGQLSQRQRAAR